MNEKTANGRTADRTGPGPELGGRLTRGLRGRTARGLRARTALGLGGRVALGLGGAVVLLLAGVQGPAVAAPPVGSTPASASAAEGSHTVELRSTAEGFTAPATTRPGLTTFNASTTQEGKGWIGLVRLKDGVGWDDFTYDLFRALGNTPAEVPQGAKDLNRDATLLGGLVIHDGQPGSFTQHLSPGTYLLFDYLAVADAQPRYRWLTVSGSSVDQGLTPTATVVSKNVPGTGPRFEVQGRVRAGQPVRFVNRIPGQVNEFLFVRIAEGTTEADLKAYFDSMPDDGSFPPGSPFTSVSLGSLPLSTGRSTVARVPTGTGPHALITWNKDATDGIKLVKKGLFTIVDVD
ncbi:hypothetical protein QFZ24_002152 [Streptomyces phaeochromogenes]|jgi:hypothetical protein|uniref:hypothetical protein n=1 Tax=Streptomyces phaeochromogenes TaxID=1923 RepID=UPI0027921955|nr:hypothetical protein [Streptomyces phaeochromogenes]MDQ0948229.1 hypothetical protein [Streptomyces phaeochromogenes]